jgi:hypothetical protein
MTLQRIKHFIAATLIALTGVLVLTPALAGATSLKCDAVSGINQLDGTSGCSTAAGSSSVSTIMSTVINILSIVVGFAAVVMIVVAGLRFITAGGDSNGIAAARSSIIYALVGLIIVAIAQVLVHFVLNKVK